MLFKKKALPVNKRRKKKAKTRPPLVSEKVFKEMVLLTFLLVAAFLAIALGSYDSQDPSWSQITDPEAAVLNKGGQFGAWISDVMLSLFGFSAWWLVVLAIFAMIYVFRSIQLEDEERSLFLPYNGLTFALFLLVSATLESGYLVSLSAHLPQGEGGMIGQTIDHLLRQSIGYTGAFLLLIILFMMSFSLFTGIQWMQVAEKAGTWILYGIEALQRAWYHWQDKRAGRMAELERTEYVSMQRNKTKDRKPVKVEPAITEIPKSDRVFKEKQTQLFETPEAGLPALDLLDPAANKVPLPSSQSLDFTSRLIERKLLDFGIEVKVITALPGPVITRYELEPSPGVKGSQVMNLAKDLARALSVVSVRVVETIPGKTYMGLEIPNNQRQIVYLSEIMSSKAYAAVSSPLAICLGKDIAGKPAVADLAKMPHLLVAGTTGSGKSVAINALILSLIYKSDASQVRMILIDPKMLELSVYEGIPHLLAPVVTDMRHAGNALNWCVAEMEKRYKLMSTLGVRNLAGYNAKIKAAAEKGEKITNPFSITPDEPEPLDTLPLIVVVIDELADLMMVVGKKVEELIARLAQKARAAGIHLVLATQRPSVDVITGLIKANVPTRIAFQVSSKIDSRTILDQMGAENLLGQGDMLYQPPGGGYPNRVHGAFVSDQEVHKVVDFLKAQGGEPNYIEGILTGEVEGGGGEEASAEQPSGAEADPLYDEAVAIVIKTRRASISGVQRQLRIGYNRAARLIEDMERAGLVSAMQSNGNREVLVPKQED